MPCLQLPFLLSEGWFGAALNSFSDTPLIKENRVSKITSSLECLDKHKFDREKQKDCVLKLYNSHSEKGVFRGMVITTLGMLGLIVGSAQVIVPSENGFLLLKSKKISNQFYIDTARSVFYEIDHSKFAFLKIIRAKDTMTFSDLVSIVVNRKRGEKYSTSSAKERVRRWVNLLSSLDFVTNNTETFSINKDVVLKTELNRNNTLGRKDDFYQTVLSAYSALASRTDGVVDIEELRCKVSALLMDNHRLIVTRDLFDQMFRCMPIETNMYRMIFGHPMGKGEKLYSYDGNFYSTVYIRDKRVIKKW